MEPDPEKTQPPTQGSVFSPFPGLVGFASAEERGAVALEADHLDILLLLITILVLILLYVFCA
jgi:hypothetical protein